MREVAGALERPGDTEIAIEESPGSAVVAIPRPRMPLVFTLALTLTGIALIAVFFAGLWVFVLLRPFPGYEVIVGEYHRLPLFWELAGLSGWLTIVGAGIVMMYAALRPLTRRERIVFEPDALVLEETVLNRSRRRKYPYRDVGAFLNRHDPQGLIESDLVLLLNRLSPDAGSDEALIAESTTESEKQWLESVLNVLLARFKGEN